MGNVSRRVHLRWTVAGPAARYHSNIHRSVEGTSLSRMSTPSSEPFEPGELSANGDGERRPQWPERVGLVHDWLPVYAGAPNCPLQHLLSSRRAC